MRGTDHSQDTVSVGITKEGIKQTLKADTYVSALPLTAKPDLATANYGSGAACVSFPWRYYQRSFCPN